MRRGGVERVATLRSRIGGNHLNGNVGSSTFRKTLSSVLLAPLQLHVSGKDRLDQASNRLVSMWMRRHLAVVTAQVEERSTLAQIEVAVLARLDPPLNLMGMAPTPIRARLRRAAAGTKRRRSLNRVAGPRDDHHVACPKATRPIRRQRCSNRRGLVRTFRAHEASSVVPLAESQASSR